MATIKAGTYRFNDVLVPYARPNTLYLGIPLVFECRTSGLIAYCEGVYVSQPDTTFQVSYMIKYTEPDYISDIGILVYEEGVWDKYGVGMGEGVKTIRIRTDSEVPDEFYEWFAANTVETSKQVCGVWKLNAELTALPFDTFKLGYYTTSYEPMITDHGADIVPVEVQGITVYRFSLANTFGDGYENGVPTVLYPAIVAYVNYGGTMMNIFVETGMFANRIADFGTEPQSVSAEFYEWLTANAVPVMASIQYNGSTISNLVGGQTARLKCKGMKMEDDVVVEVANCGGGSSEPVLQEKTITENGEYFPDEGYEGLSKVTVAVESSGVPNFPIGDGNTHIWITLGEGRTSPMLGVGVNGTVTVDWGDGSEPDILTGTSVSTVVWTPTHEYASAGDYVITLTVDGRMEFFGGGNGGTYLLRHNTANDEVNRAYIHAINKVELGNGAALGEFAFYRCDALKSIILTDSVTAIKGYDFAVCRSFASVIIPAAVRSVHGGAFGSTPGMRYCDFTKHTAVPSLAHTNVFDGASADFEIRVPAALYDEWIAATNWSVWVDYIVAV